MRLGLVETLQTAAPVIDSVTFRKETGVYPGFHFTTQFIHAEIIAKRKS
jgi:hypothetical protein